MKIELTEQQARVVAQMARLGLEIEQRAEPGNQIRIPAITPGDLASAHRACDILERAWKDSVNG